MNARKHGIKKIEQEPPFFITTHFFFFHRGPLASIKVLSVLDLYSVERSHRMPTCQRTATGDAHCRVQCFKTDWSDPIIAGNIEGLLFKQI